MANPFLARLLDTQQRGLQAERERQMRNDAFGNLGFLGQSLQRSFQPLAEMRQREALQTQAEQARANLQKQSQENEKQNIMLRNRLEAEALYKPITEEFSVQDEDGVTRTGTRPILFDAQGRRTEDVSIGRPMTRSELENIRTGQKVSAENVARLGAVFKGDVVIDGKSYSFADANRMNTIKDLEAKIRTDASAKNQVINNPFYVNPESTPNEPETFTVQRFLERVKDADAKRKTDSEKELISARGQETRGQMSIANRYARQNKILDLALDKRRYAEITKPKLYQELLLKKEFAKFANNQELAQKFAELGQKLESGEVTVDGKGLQDFIRENKIEDLNAELDITNKDAAQKLGLTYEPENGGFFEEVMDPSIGRLVPMPVVFEEVKNRLAADRTSKVTTAQMKAAEPFKKDELKRQTEQRKEIIKEEFGYNKQLKEFSFNNEKELQKIQFDYGNTKDALNRISQTTNIGEAQEALSQIEGISEGLQKSILAQVRKNNSDQTTSDNEKIFRNNLLVAQLIPDSKDKLDFLQGKGIIPEGTYVDPNSKIFVQEVLAKTVEKFDGGDTTEIVSTAKSLGLSDDQAEAFGRLAKINAGSVNRDFQQKLLYSGILSESQQFELAKKLDPSGMKGIKNFEPWKESRRVVQDLIGAGIEPSDQALTQAGFNPKNFKSIKELASKKGLNTKAKEILNGISNFLENDDVTDEQRTEYYNSINTPANKEALKSLGLSELIQFQGLSEKKLNDKQKDIDASNLQLSKQELNEAQAFYYNNYKGNSSQVQSAVTKLWLDASKDIYALHSGDNITAIEKITELTESLSEQYPGWNPPGGAGTVPSVSSQLKTGGNFNTGGNNNNQGGATENPQVNPPVINRGDFDSVENRSLNQRLEALPNYDNLSSTEKRKKLMDEPLKDKITRAEGALRDVGVKAEEVASSAFELGKDFNDWLEEGKGSIVDWVNSKVEQIKN